jgi:hypothetical protein
VSRVRRLSDESGQVLILVVASMVIFIGLAALAIDIGSWDHSQRQLQSSIDSGALAGAQDLPAVGGSVANAQTTASSFVSSNTSGNPDGNSPGTPPLTFPAPTGSGCTTSNCIAIDSVRPTKGIFAKALNAAFSIVGVHAHTQAFLGVPSSLNNLSAAPLHISQSCAPSSGCVLPKPNQTMTFVANAPLLDLNTYNATAPGPSQNNPAYPPGPILNGTTNSTQTMDKWLTVGYNSSNCTPQAPATSCDGSLPVNEWYAVDPGDHNGVKSQGLDPDIANAQPILIPVYDDWYPAGNIKNATEYHIVGFQAVVLTSDNPWNGNTKTLVGNFINYIASGLTGGPCSSCQNFGVFVVGLDG